MELYRDNGKANGNYHNGLYRGYIIIGDNGKENGNYRDDRDYIGVEGSSNVWITVKKMEATIYGLRFKIRELGLKCLGLEI